MHPTYQPRNHFGQNLLHDESGMDLIANASAICEEENLVETGLGWAL